MVKARILFVDDEAAVLDGLRDLLRKERHRWDMVFALGGEQALAEMAKVPADVVVTDMRMPGMDGPALLAKIKSDYPGTSRLVLSGQADRSAIDRALPYAQQFLTKPSDGAVLRACLARTIALRSRLDSALLKAISGSIETLPSVPRTYAELSLVAADPVSGAKEIAEVVQRDPAMATKVLQLVNSPYFGASRKITSLLQAVAHLGVETLKGLALTANLFSTVPGGLVGLELDRLRDRSVRAAELAGRFLGPGHRGDEAFTATLLHDVGKVVLAVGAKREFAAITAEAAQSGKPEVVVERERLGFTHAEAGAYLLGAWGLPFVLVEAVALHHQPALVIDRPPEVLVAGYVAATYVEAHERGRPPAEAEKELDADFLGRAGFQTKLPAWRAIAEELLSAK